MFPKNGTKVPDQNEDIYTRTIAAALYEELGDTHRAAKTLMRWTGASERSARNWLNGVRGPCGWHLILLVRHSDNIARTLLMMADRSDIVAKLDMAAARAALTTALHSLENLCQENP